MSSMEQDETRPNKSQFCHWGNKGKNLNEITTDNKDTHINTKSKAKENTKWKETKKKNNSRSSWPKTPIDKELQHKKKQSK
jgi:hypothetical protein